MTRDRDIRRDTLHNSLIADILEQDTETHTCYAGRKVKQWMRKRTDCNSELLEDVPRIVPDAWRYAQDWFYFYEVEVALPLTTDRWGAYGDLYYLLDYLHGGLSVVIVSRLGTRCEVPGHEIYIASERSRARGCSFEFSLAQVRSELESGIGFAPALAQHMALALPDGTCWHLQDAPSLTIYLGGLLSGKSNLREVAENLVAEQRAYVAEKGWNPPWPPASPPGEPGPTEAVSESYDSRKREKHNDSE